MRRRIDPLERWRQPRIRFVVVGAAKCGTTSLHRYLHQHPRLFLPTDVGVNSETGYFLEHSDQDVKGLTNREIRMGLTDDELFERIFAGHPDGVILGEESTDYAKRPHRTVELDRMRRHHRRMRILMMVRDPYDRVVSQYHHYARRRPETMADDFETEIRRHALYADISRYHFQLEPYVETFGPGRVLAVRLEDLAERHDDVMRRVFAFLGVDPDVRIDPARHNVGEHRRDGDDERYEIARRVLGPILDEDQRALDASGLVLRL